MRDRKTNRPILCQINVIIEIIKNNGVLSNTYLATTKTAMRDKCFCEIITQNFCKTFIQYCTLNAKHIQNNVIGKKDLGLSTKFMVVQLASFFDLIRN